MSVKYGGMKKILDDRSHFIINASPHNSHKRCSIPNSYNLPVDDLVHDIKNKIVEFIRKHISEYPPLHKLDTSDVPIVVYSANSDCKASNKLRKILG